MTTGRIAAAHGRFSGIRQVAQCASHIIHASLGPPDSKSQTASRTVQPFLHNLRESVPILHNGPPFSPLKIANSHRGSGPHLIHNSLSQSEPETQTASRFFQPFVHSSPQSCPIPIKIVRSHARVSGPHLIHGFFGPPESSIQRASRSVQQFLQGSLLCQKLFALFLWSPYVIGQTIIFSCCRLFFFLFFLFFPRLISAAADWMSAILPHMVWP